MNDRGSRRPIATYRLQLGPHLDLAAATDLVPYLVQLGIAELYLSPVTTAAPGSSHGYDVVDPNVVSPELGGEAALRRLADIAHQEGLGVMVDVVPNHMSTHPTNGWWADVLRHGPASPFASVFDIDWHPIEQLDLDEKVLLPVLGEPLDDELAAGTLAIEGDHLRYHDLELPLAPGTAGGDVREVLRRQHYWLEHWRSGRQRVNWRRFFGLAELVGVRVEDPDVFELTHQLVLGLAADGVVDALRVDHVDGLADPEAYLARLRDRLPGSDFPVVVEKILGPGESVRPWWPLDGTTGYDFLDRVAGLFVDREGTDRLEDLHRELTGRDESFAAVALAAQADVVERLFTADVEAVTDRAMAGTDSVDRAELRHAVVAATISLPVYRTYLRSSRDPSEVDRMLVLTALAGARRSGATAGAVEHLRAVLLGEAPPDDRVGARWVESRVRWQQLTGPVMAKGVEDTACYAHVAVAGLNDVGTAPDHHRRDPIGRFHRRNAEQAQRWPGGLNATATHDTKRGEDTRLRMLALTTVAHEWAEAVASWHAESAALRSVIDGVAAPDPGDELLLYQTVVGTWTGGPASEEYVERLTEYMVKAAREAKRRTSWIETHDGYEKALARFVDSVVMGEVGAQLAAWGERVARIAAELTLVQTVLKIASPGVPDLYQGTELWDLSLVDPDNRRAVDFAVRRALMDRLGEEPWAPPEQCGERDKLAVTARALHARRRRPDLYRRGRYLPLSPEPTGTDSVVGFARELDGEWAAVVARTRPDRAAAQVRMALPSGAPRAWVDALSGEALTIAGSFLVGDLLDGAPVVLLEQRR